MTITDTVTVDPPDIEQAQATLAVALLHEGVVGFVSSECTVAAVTVLMRSVVREEMAAAQREAFDHFDAMRQRRDDRQPPPDASLALPLTQGASDSARAKLANAAQSSITSPRGFADQAVHDLEVELSATSRWRWLKRRRLTRQLSKARSQYAVMGVPPVGVYEYEDAS